jgi:hypothetical protein
MFLKKKLEETNLFAQKTKTLPQNLLKKPLSQNKHK